MPRYQTIYEEPTTVEDIERAIWFNEACGYYTDDWSKLKITGMYNEPQCPVCNSFGLMTKLRIFLEGAKEFDRTHPNYLQFVIKAKERCLLQFNGLVGTYLKFVYNKTSVLLTPKKIIT